jgi:hypothetical protein
VNAVDIPPDLEARLRRVVAGFNFGAVSAGHPEHQVDWDTLPLGVKLMLLGFTEMQRTESKS